MVVWWRFIQVSDNARKIYGQCNIGFKNKSDIGFKNKSELLQGDDALNATSFVRGPRLLLAEPRLE